MSLANADKNFILIFYFLLVDDIADVIDTLAI
jgi:hypothetical protein